MLWGYKQVVVGASLPALNEVALPIKFNQALGVGIAADHSVKVKFEPFVGLGKRIGYLMPGKMKGNKK